MTDVPPAGNPLGVNDVDAVDGMNGGKQERELGNEVGPVVYRSQEPTSRDAGRFVATVDEADRFWSKVRLCPRDGCWLWTGAPNADGYGRFQRRLATGVYRMVKAHRYAYELLVGPIPEGLTLDHLCLHRLCVRPSHLEPVTNAENVRRRHARRSTTGETR